MVRIIVDTHQTQDNDLPPITVVETNRPVTSNGNYYTMKHIKQNN